MSLYLPLDKITPAGRMTLLIFGLFMISMIIVALVVKSMSKGDDNASSVEDDGIYAKAGQ